MKTLYTVDTIMTDTPLLEHYKDKKYEKISGGRREGILSLLSDFRAKKILDVGCANGALGKILKDIAPCDVTGIDVSASAAEAARGVLDRVYVFNTEDEQSWAPELGGKTFDVIIISEVLEHLFSPEKLLARLGVYCSKDTRVVVTVPNILFWKNRLRILLGHFEYEERGLMDRGHIHFFSWKSFTQMVEECGFALVATAHHIPTRGTRLFARYFPGLFAQTFIVALRKK